MSTFCTCENLTCPLHPSNHNNGCDPCISKNLKLKEIPNCFFSLVNGAQTRENDSFEGFARLVLNDKEKSEAHV